MADLLVLVRAPVLGPASWQPVAAELTVGAAQVIVPSLVVFADAGLPAADGPTRARYLLFSEGYGPEAAAARQRGWPVIELPGSHLHMLVDPAAVAAALVSW